MSRDLKLDAKTTEQGRNKYQSRDKEGAQNSRNKGALLPSVGQGVMTSREELAQEAEQRNPAYLSAQFLGGENMLGTLLSLEGDCSNTRDLTWAEFLLYLGSREPLGL